MKPLICAETPVQCLKDESLVNYSASVQAETLMFSARCMQAESGCIHVLLIKVRFIVSTPPLSSFCSYRGNN